MLIRCVYRPSTETKPYDKTPRMSTDVRAYGKAQSREAEQPHPAAKEEQDSCSEVTHPQLSAAAEGNGGVGMA